MEEKVMNIEEVNEITTTGMKNGLIVAAGVGATVLVGGLLYKKVVKPMIAKAKAGDYVVKKHCFNKVDDLDSVDEENE